MKSYTAEFEVFYQKHADKIRKECLESSYKITQKAKVKAEKKLYKRFNFWFTIVMWLIFIPSMFVSRYAFLFYGMCVLAFVRDIQQEKLEYRLYKQMDLHAEELLKTNLYKAYLTLLDNK